MVTSREVSSTPIVLNCITVVPVVDPSTKSIVPAVAEFTIITPFILTLPPNIAAFTVVAKCPNLILAAGCADTDTAVTGKVKAGSKAAKRRKSFCARSAGQMKKFPKAAKNPNSRLRQARRRWKC